MKRLILLFILLIPTTVFAWGYEIVSGDLNTVGSVVKIDNDEFYVIGKDENDNIKLFPKQNLSVGNVSFSTTQYWWNSTTGTLNDGYGPLVVTFESKREGSAYVYDKNASISKCVDDYVDSINEKGVCVTGRLISREELLSLGCKDACVDCDRIAITCISPEAPEWTYDSDYWLGSISKYYSPETGKDYADALVMYKNTYGVNPVGWGLPRNERVDQAGVRPVILLNTKCNKVQKTEPDKASEKLTENPPTGVFNYTFIIIIGMFVGLLFYKKYRNKTLFK